VALPRSTLDPGTTAAARAAPDEARRRSLWFPNGVRERLAAGYVAADDSASGTFESSLRHEEGHVIDGERYTPFHRHFPVLLYEVVRHGFRASAMQVTLEEHAEERSLASSAHPRAALHNTLSFLPWRLGAPPHSLAYHDLAEAVVEEIDEHPERYPSIDRAFNILQQLDRLTDAELRRALDEAVR